MRSGWPPRVLVPQAGYPKGHFTGAFDPAMGRGYRGGDQVRLPAGETATLTNHGMVDQYFRWKVILNVEFPDDVTPAANQAYFANFLLTAKYENDEIQRDFQIPAGNGSVHYMPGRSILVTAQNPTDRDLLIQYSLDEATPGLSPFTAAERLTASTGTPIDLGIPTFCSSMQLYGVSGGTNWILRGFDLTGTLLYQQVLTVPMSAAIPIVPILRYTVEPVAGVNQAAAMLYQCLG